MVTDGNLAPPGVRVHYMAELNAKQLRYASAHLSIRSGAGQYTSAWEISGNWSYVFSIKGLETSIFFPVSLSQCSIKMRKINGLWLNFNQIWRWSICMPLLLCIFKKMPRNLSGWMDGQEVSHPVKDGRDRRTDGQMETATRIIWGQQDW